MFGARMRKITNKQNKTKHNKIKANTVYTWYLSKLFFDTTLLPFAILCLYFVFLLTIIHPKNKYKNTYQNATAQGKLNAVIIPRCPLSGL